MTPRELLRIGKNVKNLTGVLNAKFHTLFYCSCISGVVNLPPRAYGWLISPFQGYDVIVLVNVNSY